ncbi:TOBE domain-containing protein [Sulfurospirillum sp. 1612]|uniref:TOBE domain-containing protein n=1 Tax=Sulfurospirillum sp. 1612 TaxID=3094835 RepID=UPI002F948601
MNPLKAEVIKIENHENLNIVTFAFGDQTLVMLGLELAEGVKLGSEVELSVKPTHVAIGKEFYGDISFSNQLSAKIIEIDNGILLSSVKLATSDAIFESIVSRKSSQRMDLNVGDSVNLFFKASDLYIKRVL